MVFDDFSFALFDLDIDDSLLLFGEEIGGLNDAALPTVLREDIGVVLHDFDSVGVA